MELALQWYHCTEHDIESNSRVEREMTMATNEWNESWEGPGTPFFISLMTDTWRHTQISIALGSRSC